MKITKVPLDKSNRMLRIGFGKHDGNWFARVDLWFRSYRMTNQVRLNYVERSFLRMLAAKGDKGDTASESYGPLQKLKKHGLVNRKTAWDPSVFVVTAAGKKWLKENPS